MRGLAVMFVSMVFLLMCAPVNCHEANGALKGVVLLADGAPAEGARVIEQEGGDGKHPHAALTDDHGRFTFPRVSPGAYDLRAYYQSTWTTWELNERVKAGKETEVTLRLP